MLLPRAAALAGLCALAIAATQVRPKHTPSAKRTAPQAAAVRWAHTLPLRDQVAQLVVAPIYGELVNTRSRDYRRYVHYVHDLRVGGIIVLGHSINGSVRNAEPYALAALINRLQKMAKTPLLVAADFERGASMRVNSAVQWPYNMAFGAAGDLDAARFEGAETARESRALGVEWVLAPDADVNNNPDNPIINTRSYGADPAQVARFVSAYIAGAHSDPKNPVLVTAKHFPGHGDTAEDSHLDLARLDVSRERLESLEFVPFRAAIAAGVDSIMTAHIAVPALDARQIPATVSPIVLTSVLRDELGFHGIVVTDALDMGGVTRLFDPAEAAVRALEAGSDVLLVSADTEKAINGVMAAVRSGRISRQRLEQSVARILDAKIRMGLKRRRTVNLDGISDVLASPEAEEVAQRVADHALTLLKNDQNLFPLKDPATTCVTVMPEGRFSQHGRVLIAELRKRAAAMKITVLEPAMPGEDVTRLTQELSGCSTQILAAFVTVSAYRGNVALEGQYPAVVNALIGGVAPVAMIAFGNPYLIRSFAGVHAYMATFSVAPTSETAVAKAIFGEIAISGHTPVPIPGFANLGDGMQVAATRAPAPQPAQE